MSYVVAIDGGATKTRCLIGDLNGNILGDYTLGASNHQTAGQKQARDILENVYFRTLEQAGLSNDDVRYAYLGLSGADLPSDFKFLNNLCANIFQNVPFKVVNDAWIAMRSGLKDSWGAISICGTGSNAAACSPDGKTTVLNALSYELGNYGGGGHIAEKALHYAFRAYEGTGAETALVKELPVLLGAGNMDELLSEFYPQRLINEADMKNISPLVFSLADKRDIVCQRILVDMGHVLGEIVAGVIKKVGMEDLKVPVVLGGSVYKGTNPLLIDELTTTVHRDVPGAYFIVPVLPPAAGAYLSALDVMGVAPDTAVYDKMEKYFL
ncbi:MAG: ATPase [Eubacterium sp.]|nr:ATPase [Eubacterium sp.]